jgi:hypothetical protein
MLRHLLLVRSARGVHKINQDCSIEIALQLVRDGERKPKLTTCIVDAHTAIRKRTALLVLCLFVSMENPRQMEVRSSDLAFHDDIEMLSNNSRRQKVE